ncbi:MAG: phosphoribosyltransferase family protein [Thermomicrobiales bacterium]
MANVTLPHLEPSILVDFKRDGLLREGHFAFRSGYHSGALIDRDRMLSDPQSASHMGYALSRVFFGNKVDTVASPSIWGAGLAQWVAYFLEPRAKVVYATPMIDGQRTIASNLHPMIEGKRVLLVDNLIISGETMGWLSQEIRRLGGEVIGVTTLWDSVEFTPANLEAVGLLNDRYPAYRPGECPLCLAGHSQPEHVPY